MHVSFDAMRPGAVVRLFDTDGDVYEFISKGQGRYWLDCMINGMDAILLAFYLPFNGDSDLFRRQVEESGGLQGAAAHELGAGMTAHFMVNGENYLVPVSDVVLV